MKYGWIIYTKQSLKSKFGNNAFDWMISAAKENNLAVDIIFEEDLDIIVIDSTVKFFHKNSEISPPDFVHLRSYCLDLAASLNQLGIKLINKINPLSLARNKWATQLRLAQFNIPQPKSILLRIEEAEFSRIEEQLNSPFVVKEIFGSKGEKVYLVKQEKDLEELKIKLTQAVICQEFINESSGTDLRIHVIGDKAVVGIKRENEADFRSNYHLGGTAKVVSLTKEQQQLAIQATLALGLEIAGVDILLSHKGPLVCEVNGIPAFRTVAKFSEVDIPDQIFNYINNKLSDSDLD